MTCALGRFTLIYKAWEQILAAALGFRSSPALWPAKVFIAFSGTITMGTSSYQPTVMASYEPPWAQSGWLWFGTQWRWWLMKDSGGEKTVSWWRRLNGESSLRFLFPFILMSLLKCRMLLKNNDWLVHFDWGGGGGHSGQGLQGITT